MISKKLLLRMVNQKEAYSGKSLNKKEAYSGKSLNKKEVFLEQRIM